MKINIVTIAYNLPQATEKLFQTAMLDADKHDISFQLFLHSKHQETMVMCELLAKNYPCAYYPYGINRGLANSWNEGLLLAYGEMDCDVAIIANDDIYFGPGDIDKLATKAQSCRDNYMVSVAGYNHKLGRDIPSIGYSCFALNPIAMERIGCFDQNFYPIYCEDSDHHRRAHLQGLVETNCADTKIYHGGSSAITKDPKLSRQNIVTQNRNGQYFYAKWNATEPLGPGYKVPFNDKKFNLYIDPKDRFAPYPGYNREDQHIVRF